MYLSLRRSIRCVTRTRYVAHRPFSTEVSSNNHSTSQTLDQQQATQHVNQTSSQPNPTVQPIKPIINASQAQSMHNRGVEWFSGNFGRVDYDAALVWFQQAAAAQHAPSINRLALMNLLGYGCDKSTEKAIELFRQAALLGDIDAANHLAALLQSASVSSKPNASKSQSDKQSNHNQEKMREAADLFEQAARGGHSRAALNLGKLILVGNSRPLAYDQALIWLEQAAEAKLSEAAYLAGLIHLHRPPLAPSLNRSISKAVSSVIEQVHASRFQLVPLNVNRGFELLAQAAELGSSDAHCDLGDWYLDGTAPLTRVDQSIAAAHYRAAAEVGNAVGQARLGMMIAHGLGVTRDRNEALLWLTTSANANNNDAHLGLTYLTLTQPDLTDTFDSNGRREMTEKQRDFTLTQPDLTDTFGSNGRREMTEKQRDFIRDMLSKVSESIRSIPSSAPEVKAGILALQRDPWLLVHAFQSVAESTGKPWVKGTDTLMRLIPRA